MAAQRKLPSWMNQGKVERTSSNSAVSKDKTECGVPKLHFPGKVTYCYNKDECNFICHDIRNRSAAGKVVVGFDIEWKVTYRTGDYHKTAVLQLCTGSNNCYIFQLVHMDGFPSELGELLQDERILKLGVGIKGDMGRLAVDYNISASGVVDLAVLANEQINNFENWSLNGLLMNQVRFQLSKCESVRCSDWEAVPLSITQLEYAALDAYAAVLIYERLITAT